MRFDRGLLSTVTVAALVSSAFIGVEHGAIESDNATTLAYQPCPEWSFICPNETWNDAEAYVGVGHARDDEGFASERTGVMALEIDTNGDGKLDQKVKGQRGFAKLRGQTSTGRAFEYAVRLRFQGQGYQWSPGSCMAGKIKGQTLKLIDQNGNGEFDDFGVDALVIGSTQAASYLSRVVNLGGELFNLELSADGVELSVTPYNGASGTLDVVNGFKSNGALLAAIVNSGENSFNVAGAGTGLRVPVGEYELVSGFVEKAGETAWIRRGKSSPLDVKAGEKLALAWGASVVAEFDYTISGERISVPPTVNFYGQAGEEYHSFRPEAKSPKILITDKATGKLVESGRFGGC